MSSLKHKVVSSIGTAIFAIRWLLVPIYLLLYVALAVYVVKYSQEIWHIVHEIDASTSSGSMLMILELIDMGMIANLVVMTTIGGYSIFVKEFAYDTLADRPRWLNKDFSSSEQKIKMGMSLIGVALVNLLNDFIMAPTVDWLTLSKRIAILASFLLGTLGFCYINNLMHPAHKELPHEH